MAFQDSVQAPSTVVSATFPPAAPNQYPYHPFAETCQCPTDIMAFIARWAASGRTILLYPRNRADTHHQPDIRKTHFTVPEDIAPGLASLKLCCAASSSSPGTIDPLSRIHYTTDTHVRLCRISLIPPRREFPGYRAQRRTGLPMPEGGRVLQGCLLNTRP